MSSYGWQVAMLRNGIRRSIRAPPGIDDPVVLPPGQHNDELGDLLQWIANAKLGDEQAIRSEISRRYSDIGDTLNSALDTVLEIGGVTRLGRKFSMV